jgi:nicotinate-nucleotide pyrophosphorylase (carboxylating)
MDPNALSLAELYAAFSRTGLVRRLIELSRDEDLGVNTAGVFGPLTGDITSTVCPFDPKPGAARIGSRAAGVCAGLAVVPDVLAAFAPQCAFAPAKHDGTAMFEGEVLGEITGPTRQILAAERTLLNILGRLSGIATRTRRFVDEMDAGIPGSSRARLLDTRKTTPGLRVLEKYAVRCGGGFCHRLGLFDAVLIKDNHLAHLSLDALPGFVRQASAAARQSAGGRLEFFEVEVDSLAQLDALMTLEPGVVDIVLLDNMGPQSLRQAVAIRDRKGPKPLLEASGGVRLENVAEIAATGVDRVSVGSLTHGATSLDVGLDMR